MLRIERRKDMIIFIEIIGTIMFGTAAIIAAETIYKRS